MASTSKKEKKQQMQVFVRVRPLNKQEGNNSVVEVVSTKELSVKTHGGFKKFIYDRVFGPDSKQIDVYKLVAEPAVKEVMSGYNCTVLAYGQTGTGKTYTMAGGSATDMHNTTATLWYEDVHSGIIPRTMSHMFDELRINQLEFTVRVSYLELYNEEIFDLLSPLEDNTKLKLYDDSVKKGSVIVSGLTEVTVNSKTEVYQVLENGSAKRKFASTLMNAQSSRSHTVFCITLHTKENAVGSDDVLKMGKLYLVDLAGSENIRQSGATDIRAREAVSINQSLLTLGRCITKLIEHCGHIPYRESKLTRLLQDSLGGRTKATLIATVSPAASNTDETLNTLMYAFQAKSITNKPEINQRLSKKTLLKEYTEEIERLRKDLAATRMGKGVYLAEDNYEALLRSRDGFKDELTEKIGQVRVMQEQLKSTEQVLKDLKMECEVHEKEAVDKALQIESLTYQLQDQTKAITDLKEDNELKQLLVERFSKTEEQYKSTAKELISVVDATTGDTRKLHNKLDVLADLTQHNRQVCEQHISEFNAKIDGITNKLRNFHEYEFHYNKYMVDMLHNLEKDFTMHESKSQEMGAVLGSLRDSVTQHKNDVNCCAQSMNVNIELAHCNVAQAIKNSQQICLEQFNENVIQQVQNLCDHIQTQDKNICDSLYNWRKMINTHHTSVIAFVDSCKKLILESKEEVHKFIEEQTRSCAQLSSNLINQNRNTNAFFKTFMETYSKENDASLRELDGMHQSLQNISSVYTKTSDNTCSFIDQFADSLQVSKQEHHQAVEDADVEASNVSGTLVNSMRTVNDLLHKHKDDAIASYQLIEDASNHESYNLGVMVIEQFAKPASELQQTAIQLEEVKDSLESDMSEISEKMSNHTSAMRSTGEEHEMCCSEMDSIVGTELVNCREGFRRLYTSSLKEYKVTGETPQRKTYRYPRNLPETLPDKLVEQWRQERLQSAESKDKENQVNDQNQPTKNGDAGRSDLPSTTVIDNDDN